MEKFRTVALSEIRENPAALRSVNRQAESYLGLVDSIKEKGFIGTIIVREATDPETKESYLELVDGLHRFSASKDAGIEEISVNVTTMDDAAVLEGQIMMNIHKVETKPVEYSKALLRILAMNPMMTEAELATKLGKSSSWISERLGLNKIDNAEIVELINDGKICLANAYALAKLPPEEAASFVDSAMTLPTAEFVPTVNARAKEIRDAARQGKDAAPVEFQAVAHLQKVGEIKAALENQGVIIALAAQNGVSDVAGAIKLTLEWCLHLDSISVEAQRAKNDERIAAKAESAEKRKRERAEKLAKKKQSEAADAVNAVKELDESKEA